MLRETVVLSWIPTKTIQSLSLRETVVLSWIPTKTIQSLSLRETVVLSLTPTQDNSISKPKSPWGFPVGISLGFYRDCLYKFLCALQTLS